MKKKKRNLITGTVSKHRKGFGFVVQEGEEGDIYISAADMHGAMNGDTVEVDLIPEYLWKGSRQGIITKVLERNMISIVGTFERNKRFGFVTPQNRKNDEDLFIRKRDFGGARRGDKVVARITRYPDRKNSAEGKITEIISRSGEAGGDIKAFIRGAGLRETFPSRVRAEAKAVSKWKIQAEGRRDLRDKTVITIDGADSKDFDDGVSIERLPGGNYLLGVHIADVAHYVQENSPMDMEALKRGNSVYLLDQVIPMLPKKLSNGACSLNPDVDRLTLSVDMELTPEGDLVHHEIYESVIHSKARMVYTEVSDLLEHEDDTLIQQYRHLYDDLLLMGELAGVLRKKREARGSLDFDLDEAHIVLDQRGIPVSVDIAERRTANKLIEEFMLLANETVAEHFYWMEVPFVYRVHESPSAEKMEEFRTFIRSFGFSFAGSTSSIHPKTLGNLLKQVEETDYENIVNSVMLRSMQKAFYGVDCQGHFGLSLKYYCHFTSPIRRYPDLMIHRVIKDSINGRLDDRAIKKYKSQVQAAADIASAAERQAINLEREVEKLKKAEYMSYRIGEAFSGIISGVTNFGIYVVLPNTVEGMIRLDSLRDDYYDCEPAKYRVIGQRTHKIYSLGQKVEIIVESVDVENREINFEFCKKR